MSPGKKSREICRPLFVGKIVAGKNVAGKNVGREKCHGFFLFSASLPFLNLSNSVF
jgi:hypothetical protein